MNPALLVLGALSSRGSVEFAGMRRVRRSYPAFSHGSSVPGARVRGTHDAGTRLGAQRQVLLVAMSVELDLDHQGIGTDQDCAGIGLHHGAPR